MLIPDPENGKNSKVKPYLVSPFSRAKITNMTPVERRIQIANETLSILKTGSYYYDGTEFSIEKELADCIAGTETIEIAPKFTRFSEMDKCEILVSTESTTAAIQRCLKLGGHVAALNFASDRSPGGGFETGAQAQEECIARASGLYPSLISQQAQFYDKNIAEQKPFYSHRMIWSPLVPFFRDENDYITEKFCASVITAAAPNQNRIPVELKAQTEAIFKARIRRMLTIAAYKEVDHLVLGAWGCGVFGNDPAAVAAWFQQELNQNEMKANFNSVTFAVFCPLGPDANFNAFQKEFEKPE